MLKHKRKQNKTQNLVLFLRVKTSLPFQYHSTEKRKGFIGSYFGDSCWIWKISQFFRVWIRDCDWMEDCAWFCLKWAKTLIFSEFWIVGLELFTLGDCLRWWYLTLLLWVWKKIAYTVISDWDFDYRFWTRCIGWRSPFLVFFFFFCFPLFDWEYFWLRKKFAEIIGFLWSILVSEAALWVDIVYLSLTRSHGPTVILILHWLGLCWIIYRHIRNFK